MNILSQLQQLVSFKKKFQFTSLILALNELQAIFFFPYTTNKIIQNVQRYSAMELVI